MNKLLNRSIGPAVAGAFFFAAATLASAQVVTTGIVTGVTPQGGIVTLHSDQSNRPVYFRNMDKAKIVRSSGAPAKFEDVWTGMRVTVSYAQRGGIWFVGSLAIPDLPPPAASQDWIWMLTPGQRQSLYAPRTTDITKRPGNNAATDNDITTKPPRRGLFERDITLRNDNR